MIRQFIESIKEEKEGYSFDRPWRLEEKSLGVILPIIRKTDKKRDYITFAEAQQIKVEDTGQIDHVYVKNDEDKSVFISRGEIFRGKTQERAAIHGYIIPSGKGLRVAVRCIHQSKGISSGAEMEYGGRAPYSIDFSDQSKTWNTVHQYSSSVRGESTPETLCSTNIREGAVLDDLVFGSTGGPNILRTMEMNMGAQGPQGNMGSQGIQGSDDLVNTIGELSGSIKEAMKRIPFIENQAGAIFFKENELMGMDVYDVPESWDSVKKDIVEKEGSDFMEREDETEMFEFKPEKAVALAKKKLSVDFEEKEIYNKEYKVVEIRSKKVLGEATIFNNCVIHLTLWKKQ